MACPRRGGTGDTALALPDDYATRHAAPTEAWLLRAGLRLAALLNARLRPAPP